MEKASIHLIVLTRYRPTFCFNFQNSLDQVYNKYGKVAIWSKLNHHYNNPGPLDQRASLVHAKGSRFVCYCSQCSNLLNV
jgi:hypothetical protein